MKQLLFILSTLLIPCALHGALAQSDNLVDYENVSHIDWRACFKAQQLLEHYLKTAPLETANKAKSYTEIMTKFGGIIPLEHIIERCIHYSFINSQKDLVLFFNATNTTLPSDIMEEYMNVLGVISFDDYFAARVNQHNDAGYTKLMFAAQKNNHQIVASLFQDPCINVNIQNKYGDTALIIAAQNGHYDVAASLLQHPDINVNIQESHGETALVYAVKKGHLNVVALLLQHPAIDVNIQDKARQTALLWAIENNHENIVALLLQNPRIDLHIQNIYGRTALQYAKSHNKENIVHLIEEALRTQKKIHAYYRNFRNYA